MTDSLPGDSQRPMRKLEVGSEEDGLGEELDISSAALEGRRGVSIISRPDQEPQDEANKEVEAVIASSEYLVDDKPFSYFTHNEKRIIMVCAGLCGFFSPVSSNIYLPSLDVISADLNVSYTLINLTVSVYQIVQGLAPSFVGGFSDSSGRRPAYLLCFILYIAANIGLALQNNYAALLVLRCLQSAGASGTVVLANGIVSDIVTSQERGVYISYMSVGSQAGPSLGPIIGGLLGQYLGWHSIFWFLLIASGVVSIIVGIFLPETNRNIVEDGTIPPPKWSRCYMNNKLENRLLAQGKPVLYNQRDELARNRRLRFPNPLETLKVVFTREAGYILGYIGVVCCGYYAVTALIPSQFGRIYGFNQIQIALCYIPLGGGSLCAGLVRGRIIDQRYRYHAKKLGMPLESNRKVDLSNFPIERARLEVAIPTLFLGTIFIIGFGWMVQYETNLSGPLIFLFIIGFTISAALNTVSVLLVDLYPGKAATATSANNIVRCWLGAGATTAVIPLIDKIGIGWTVTFFAGLNFLGAPVLWWVMREGPRWRMEAGIKREGKERESKRERDVGGEKGG